MGVSRKDHDRQSRAILYLFPDRGWCNPRGHDQSLFALRDDYETLDDLASSLFLLRYRLLLCCSNNIGGSIVASPVYPWIMGWIHMLE